MSRGRVGSLTEGPRGPLRVAHVVLELHRGGLERIVFELALAQLARGTEIRVFCLQSAGDLATQLPLGVVHVVAERRGLRSLIWPRALAKAIRRYRPDAVHVHSGVWLKGTRAAKLAKVPVIVTTDHGRPTPDSLAARVSDSVAASQADLVVAVSSPLRDYLIARRFASARKIRVVRNGIATSIPSATGAELYARTKFGIPKNAFVFGTVGRLAPVKRHDLLLHAFQRMRASLPGPPWLLIVGDGSERARLQELAVELRIADVVTFAGWQAHPRALLAAMDAFVLSSDSEGTPVALLEALEHGLPTIATAVGGNVDVLAGPLARWLSPPGNASLLADLMKSVASLSRIERDELASIGRRYVREQFSFDAMVESYEALYSNP